ncbi:MAG: DNA repair protein, partial [Nitrospiraceae bacterium]|nr:DNA repair protein [Nitrospiraceae bacterium]
FRGTDHGMSEEQYNLELLRICHEENVKVLGIADHGNVDGVNGIHELMREHDIVVFPGFEIASSGKVHFVCLFAEDTSTDTLNRYLGNLELIDPKDGVRPSKLSAEQLLQKVDELGGVVYAAHCTEKSGVLKQRLNNVWKNPLLKAAQIPGSLDDLKGIENDFYRKLLLNKIPDYKRERSVAILNAKDVEKPETLRNPTASCLIKMTKPCFASFKQAFLDPESRVRLNSDVPEKYYSRIERVTFTGGYLDGLDIEFSEHLNAVIGGRGTGKSTLLESIRYGLEMQPLGTNAKKQHIDIIKENLGKEKGRIEITIRSSKMNGKRFTIARRYGESTTVKDEDGNISTFTPADLLPRIEIYGQNEIYEIAQDTTGQLKLLKRFLDVANSGLDPKHDEIIKALQKNRKKIISAQEKLSEIEDEVLRLPKLVEQAEQFKSLGLEEKLNLVPLLEKEKRLSSRIVDELQNLYEACSNLKEQLPDTVFLSDKALEGLPHQDILKSIRQKLNELKSGIEPLLNQIEIHISKTDHAIGDSQAELSKTIKDEEAGLEKLFAEIPSYEGKSGKEIGIEFRKILREIERIRPKESLLKSRKAVVEELQKKRGSLLAELSEVRSERSAQLQRALKRLNKKLEGKLRLSVLSEANRQPLLDFLNRCNLEGVGPKRLAWITTADDFSPVKLAETIRHGVENLRDTGWGITPSVADALVKLKEVELMEMEEIELPDTITIELNVAHEGAEKYRPLDKLSTGQQCTAILHMLLLENKDPLIMDQPEDNLDNAFIADRIVTELRSAKIARQFLFATHNANIPVFGDAEWIGVFQAEENHATIPENAQGAIDLPDIQQKASEILEGGKIAFIQRKEKYGF